MNKLSKKNTNKRKRKQKKEEEDEPERAGPCTHCKTMIYGTEGLQFSNKWYCFSCAQSQINLLANQKHFFGKCNTCRGAIPKLKDGLKFSDGWYCFGCCQEQIDIILMNCSNSNNQKQVKKCKNCKQRKEITCSNCQFNYTQLVCRHCEKEHHPHNIKYKDMDDGKPAKTFKRKGCTENRGDTMDYEIFAP